MSLYDCLKCGKEVGNQNQFYFVIPSEYIVYPNSYFLCDEHKELRYDFKHIYNEDGSRREKLLDPRDVTVDFPMKPRNLDDIKIACNMHKWININDRLPKYNDPILFSDGEFVFHGERRFDHVFKRDEWLIGDLFNEQPAELKKVTHWMPLPEPPEKE